MKTPFLHIIILIVAFAAIGRAMTVEDAVCAELSQRGLSLGYNERRGVFVCLGKAMTKLDNIAPHPLLAAERDRVHKIASLEARGKILQMLSQSLTAERNAEFQNDGNADILDLDTVSKVFSERVLTGWQIIATAEKYSDGVYSAAVVVEWSNKGEDRLNAVKSGRIAPSGRWNEELLAYIRSQKLSCWSNIRVFVDSAGFPHMMGVGLSDWNGDERTREIARRKADMFAQSNLMLGLYGDIAIMEAAGKWRKEAFRSSDSDVLQRRFYKSMSEVRIRRNPPDGCRPFHVAVVENPLNGGKEIVSIYSFEPNIASECGDGRDIRRDAGADAVEPAVGVMIFNPSTGKYER